MPVRVRFLSVPICVLACASVQAQWRGSAGMSVGETYSDNINRGDAGQQRDDFATDVAPWFNYAGRGARSSGSIDAKLHNWFHSDQQTAGRTELQLNAKGNLEAVENTAFIDASISNNRERVSQFKAADSSYGGNSNSAEVTRYSLSPYVKWRLGSSTNGEFRLGYDQSHSGSAGFSNYTTESARLNLVNGSAFGRLGWGFNAAHVNTDRNQYASTSTDSYSGTLTYAFDPELSGRIFGGQEFNDYGGTRRHYWNDGAGIKWQPNERTTLDLQSSRNFFGRGFNYQLTQRMNQSALTARYSKDASTSSLQSGQSALQMKGVSSVEMYFALLMAREELLKSSISDSHLRELQAIQDLKALGQYIDLSLLGGTTSINKQASLGWILSGVRNTVSLGAYKSEASAYSQASSLVFGDDLSTYQRTRSRGYNAAWSVKLSELSSVGLHYSWSSIDGYGASNTRTSSHTGILGLDVTTRLSPQTSASAGIAETRSKGNLEYLEHSVSLTLNHTF